MMTSPPPISVQPQVKTMHSRDAVTHRAVCGWDCGLAVQGSLAESLIDWDKGLLMRQIAHQAGTTCF